MELLFLTGGPLEPFVLLTWVTFFTISIISYFILMYFFLLFAYNFWCLPWGPSGLKHCHWLHAPLPVCKSRLGHGKRLPLTLSLVMVFTRYSGFLHHLQLAWHILGNDNWYSKLIFRGQFFFWESNCIFKSYLKVLCIETSTSLGSLQKL